MTWFGMMTAAVAVLICAVANAAVADELARVHVQVGVDQYGWKEYFSNGGTAVTESGPLLTLGAGWDNLRRVNSGRIYSVGARAYSGQVNYTGYSQNLQTGALTPLTSRTNYDGVQFDGFGGYRLARDLFGVDFLGGGGLDAWHRSLGNATDANGNTSSGYQETYLILNAKLGTGFFQDFGSWSYRIQAGAKYPVYTFEHVNYLDGIDLSPGKRVSPFAKLEFEFGPVIRNHFGLILSYESYRFSPSAAKPLTNGGVPVVDHSGNVLYAYQPESHQDVYRLSGAYYFR